MSDDYRQVFKDTIISDDNFVEATFKPQPRVNQASWQKLTLRPVVAKKRRQIQFSYSQATRIIVKNYDGNDLVELLDEILALPLQSLQLKTTHELVRVQFSRKGKAILHRDQVRRPAPPSLAHDRQKAYVLPASLPIGPEKPDPFLYAIGITTKDGIVKANMQRKYRQINQFLKMIEETVAVDALEDSPIRIVDFGCGNAYLTFAAYHYFAHVVGRSVELTGVDVKAHLLESHIETSRNLGWESISFEATRISDFQPAAPPSIILALHACDTATDDALAQGIKNQSRYIFSAPCCHHHLQSQLNPLSSPASFQPVVQHGILKQRLGDILTDAFRALILRIMGYQSDVIEFVATEHTLKNLMIRASKSLPPGDPRSISDYEEMKASWQVVPYLEDLLGDELARFLIHR
jgi:SAM-dependent methyltransferase